MTPQLLKTILPILILAVVLGFRLRSMARPQPLRSTRLWLLPAILLVIGVASLAANPPPPSGWAICSGAFIIGGMLGWRRGKLIRIWRDAENGEVMQQASPAAMLLLLGIIAARFILRAYFGVQTGAAGPVNPQALLVTDALLTFAIGLIAATRAELFVRMRKVTEPQ